MPAPQTMADARRRFFARQGFSADGGYDEPWADASFGPLPYAVPNPPARAAALRVHDLHHVLTGYGTSWQDESKISAWELGSGGGGRYLYAWFIALFGLFVGVALLPRATYRAFVRGRGARNLYREASVEPWLPRSVDDVRRELRIDARPRHRRPRAVLAFAGYGLAALALATAFMLGSPLLVLLGMMRRAAQGSGCPIARALAQ